MTLDLPFGLSTGTTGSLTSGSTISLRPSVVMRSMVFLAIPSIRNSGRSIVSARLLP